MTPIKLIQQAIEDAVRKDDQSSPHKKLLTTSERNIAFHIGSALEQVISEIDEFKRYQVDVEYNRQGENDDPKKLNSKRVIPDIVIHKRGLTHEDDNDANYLWIEIKMIWNFNGKRDSITNAEKKKDFHKDKHKLVLARSEKHYEHAAFLIFNRRCECFLEIDNNAEHKDAFSLLPLTQASTP